jgi:predicted dehydrogenase
MSAVSGRITDVDVVSDLMVHDLDIILDLVPSPLVELDARAVRGPQRGIDYVVALLGFENGAMASVTASRITQNQVRTLEVTTDQRFFTVDYPSQELLIYRQGRIGGLDPETDASRYVLDVGTERVFVRRIEPLAAEMAHFIAVVRGTEAPLVSGHQALSAMRVVWSIKRLLEEGTS